jgi:hypothetical protein
MSKFMLLYNGPATPPDMMDEAKRNKIMMDWKTWMESVGPAMLEMGSPMGNGRSVVDDGSAGQPLEISGYSIVEAANIDEAVKLVNGHPFLVDKTGKFSVEVFELFPSPSM